MAPRPGRLTPSAQIVAGPNPVANAVTATIPVGNVERPIGEYPDLSCGIAFAAR